MSSPASPGEPPPEGEQARWFVEEVQPHEALLRRYLRGRFPGADPDDVIQESYLRLWRVRFRQAIASPKAFLFQVARRIGIDQARRRQASPVNAVADPASLPASDPSADIRESACNQEELRLLAAAIDSLPPRCRAVVLLRTTRDLSHHEIAAELGLSPESVTRYLARAVVHLRLYWQEKVGS